MFECRVLLPEKLDGATIELRDRDKQARVIETHEGHLCYRDASGRRTVLVRTPVGNMSIRTLRTANRI